MHDPEDRDYWRRYGAELEYEFLPLLRAAGTARAIVNPAKLDRPWEHDLIVGVRKAEVKSPGTIFRSAMRLYGIPPKFCVTYNLKDQARYEKLYDDLLIFFWVRWLEEVYYESLESLGKLCAKAPIHVYEKRIDDDENAKASYVLDVRDMTKL